MQGVTEELPEEEEEAAPKEMAGGGDIVVEAEEGMGMREGREMEMGEEGDSESLVLAIDIEDRVRGDDANAAAVMTPSPSAGCHLLACGGETATHRCP